MLKFLIIFTFVQATAYSQIADNNWQKLSLKGKVKQIETTYTIHRKANHNNKNGADQHTIPFFDAPENWYFNKNGFLKYKLIKQSASNKHNIKESYFYKQDSILYKIEKYAVNQNAKWFISDSVIISNNQDTIIYKNYSILNNSIDSVKYVMINNKLMAEFANYPDGNNKITYEYDDNKQLTKEIYHYPKGNTYTWNTQNFYNENNILISKHQQQGEGFRVVKKEYYPENGLIKSESFNDQLLLYNYKFDNFSNWIRKEIAYNNKIIYTVKRTIKYYGNK